MNDAFAGAAAWLLVGMLMGLERERSLVALLV
jgi:hypothetical protein